jgi:hypothetical protein
LSTRSDTATISGFIKVARACVQIDKSLRKPTPDSAPPKTFVPSLRGLELSDHSDWLNSPGSSFPGASQNRTAKVYENQHR